MFEINFVAIIFKALGYVAIASFIGVGIYFTIKRYFVRRDISDSKRGDFVEINGKLYKIKSIKNDSTLTIMEVKETFKFEGDIYTFEDPNEDAITKVKDT